MKRYIQNKTFYILPIIVWDKRDSEYNVLHIGWFYLLFYKTFKKASK